MLPQLTEFLEENNDEINSIITSWGKVNTHFIEKRVEVEYWFSNFAPSEYGLALKIMSRVQYKSDDDTRKLIKSAISELKAIFIRNFENVFFFPLGDSSATSGSSYLYDFLKNSDNLNEGNFKFESYKDYLKQDCDIVFIDDIIGSGNQASKFYNETLINSKANCYYVSLYGFQDGVKKVRGTGFKKVISCEEISFELKAFHPESEVFSEFDKEKIKELCYKHGKRLFQNHELGYDDSQALIVFPNQVPNNTLPVIWASSNNEKTKGERVWNPLFERKKQKTIKSKKEKIKNQSSNSNSSNNKIIFESLPLRPTYNIIRNELSENFDEILIKNKIVKVQGIGGSGKSTFVNNYCRRKIGDHKKYIWYTCSKSETELDILNNLYELNIPTTRKSKQIRIRSLVNYLNENSAILILDDFDKVNNTQFIQLFRSMNHFAELAKIICISSIDNNYINENYDYVVFPFPNYYSELEVKKILNLKYHYNASLIDLKKLFEVTNFLPRFIQYLISSDTVEDFNLKLVDSKFTKKIEGWFKLIESNLKSSHIKCLICLSYIDGTFPKSLLKFLADKYNIENDDIENSLNKPLIFSQFENSRLKLNEMISKYYRKTNEIETVSEIYNTIASYFRSIIKSESDRVKILLLSLRSIKYFQLAKNYSDAKFVIDKNIKGYKLEGMYEEIIPILKLQLNNSESDDVNWLNYHYAHVNYIIGNYAESLASLRSQIYSYPSFSIKDKRKIQSIIRYELKVFLLYTELLSATGQSAIAIDIILRKINKIVVQDYSVSELSWQVTSQFISNLAWYLIENKEYDKAINILNKLNNSTLLIQKDYSLAINNTRLAVAHYYNEDFNESKRLLELAYEIFDSDKIKDNRAKAWVSSYFVKLYVKDNQLKFEKSIKEYLRTCLEINSEIGLIDIHYFEMLKMISLFHENIKFNIEPDLIQLIEDEVLRQNNLIINSIEVIEKEEFIEITKTILGGLNDKDYNMYSLVNRFLNKKAVKISSSYFKSFLNNVKHNATKVLEHVFSTKEKKEIFITPYLNRIITVAIKFDKAGIDKYIVDNIDIISSETTNSIRLHYVRALSEGDRKKFAVDLLEKIKDKSSEFYNLYGNAISDSNKYESYKNYNIALKMSNSTYDKGRYLNNLAWLIYKYKWKSKYEEAVEYCNDSLKYRKYHYKFWPYSMQCLLLLNIDATSLNNVEDEFRKNINAYNLNVKIKWTIIDKIEDKRKKTIIENFGNSLTV